MYILQCNDVFLNSKIHINSWRKCQKLIQSCEQWCFNMMRWHTMNSNVSFYVLAKWWCNDDLQNDFLRSVKFGIDFRTIIHSFYTFKYFIHWMIGEISRAFVEALATEIFTFLFCWKLYRQKSFRIIQPKYGVLTKWGLGGCWGYYAAWWKI